MGETGLSPPPHRSDFASGRCVGTAQGWASSAPVLVGHRVQDRAQRHPPLLEVPGAVKVLEGVAMELEDCAFPTLCGVEIGDFVGYQVRFTDQSSEETLVKVMTDGILLAQIQRDPQLLAYDTLVIDGVQIRFVFEGRGRSRFRTVSLFNPNSTNLSDTARDRVIRSYLPPDRITAAAPAGRRCSPGSGAPPAGS